MPSFFISYAHKDEALKDELLVHLAPLVRDTDSRVWDDRKILPGDEFDQEISREMEQAEIILLLISPDFLASRYCYDIEVQRAIEKHVEQTARVIPIILRPCDWTNCPLAALLAAPRDGKPITKWSNLDEAFLDVITQIRSVVSRKSDTAKIPVPRLKQILESITRIKISNNLRQLSSAVDQFLLENGVVRAKLSDIIGDDKYLKQLKQIDGEQYDNLDLTVRSNWVLTTQSGLVVTYKR